MKIVLLTTTLIVILLIYGLKRYNNRPIKHMKENAPLIAFTPDQAFGHMEWVGTPLLNCKLVAKNFIRDIKGVDTFKNAELIVYVEMIENKNLHVIDTTGTLILPLPHDKNMAGKFAHIQLDKVNGVYDVKSAMIMCRPEEADKYKYIISKQKEAQRKT